LDSRSITNDLT